MQDPNIVNAALHRTVEARVSRPRPYTIVRIILHVRRSVNRGSCTKTASLLLVYPRVAWLHDHALPLHKYTQVD